MENVIVKFSPNSLKNYLKLKNAIYKEASRIARNAEVEEATVDHRPECLHFWMRGINTTEPGEPNLDYAITEPTKYQSVTRPAAQYRIEGPLSPAVKLEGV